jgi:hypothetical protein
MVEVGKGRNNFISKLLTNVIAMFAWFLKVLITLAFLVPKLYFGPPLLCEGGSGESHISRILAWQIGGSRCHSRTQFPAERHVSHFAHCGNPEISVFSEPTLVQRGSVKPI